MPILVRSSPRRPAAVPARVGCAVVLALAAAGAAAAQDYYVDPVAGSDTANPGTSTSAPFQTVAHAGSVADSGDTILLKAGSVAREGAITISNATLTAYGSGAMPVITASTPETSWTAWSGHAPIMTASVAAPVVAVYCQGVLQTLARYPNVDAADPWLHTGAATTVDTINDPTLSGDTGKWQGAEVRWRRWSWWFETRTIQSDDGNGNLTMSSASALVLPNVSNPSGYYIDNSLAALDEAGEWFWDSGTSTLYFYPPSGANLPGGDVEVLTSTTGVSLSGATVNGVAFREFADTALGTNDRPCTVENCAFSQIEDTAIQESYNAGGSLYAGNSFTDIRNNGIDIIENPGGTHGTQISGNTFERIGMIPGYGGSGACHSNGIWLNVGTGITVTQNRMSDVGADGVMITSGASVAGNTVTDNILVRCMSTLNDGSAIYTDCSDTDIENNLIFFSIGNLVSCQPWTPLGHGIWCDDVSGPWTGDTIRNNVVVASGGYGLFFPHPDGSTVSGNTFIGDQIGEMLLNDDTSSGFDADPEDITFTGNTLVGLTEHRFIAQPAQNLASWADQGPDDCVVFTDGVDYGTTSGSVLDVPSGAAWANAGSTSFTTIGSWQAGRSWVDPAPTTWNRDAVVVVNDTASAATVPTPAGTWITGSGAAAGSSVHLSAFSGTVLLAAPGVSVAAQPVLTTASGTDYTQPDPFSPPGAATGTATATGGGSTATAEGTTTATSAGAATAGATAGAGGGGGGGGGGCGLGGSSAVLVAIAAAFGRRWRRRSDRAG